MPIPEQARRAVVSVVEMAAMLDLSRSRFYVLIQAGIFPHAVRNASCKRPAFDADAQQKCLTIRRTGIGLNGLPVLFNRKRRQAPQKSGQALSKDQEEMVEALKTLGLTASAADVQAALVEVYPNGCNGTDQGEVLRQVFLRLRRKK
jgi:hypothetical protein